VSEAETARQYDRWLTSGSLTGKGYRFLASVPGSMLVNTPIFRLDRNLVLRPDQRLLDIGCGSGSLLQLLASRVRFEAPPVGIDLSRAMLVAAQAQAASRPVELVQGAGTSMPLRSDAFDIVTCSYVLKHLDDGGVATLLAEVLRVLKPGGIAVLWEFAPVRSEALNRWNRWVLTRGVQSCNFRSYGDLAHMATSAGFDWVENANLRPFLLPPIPRVSIVAGKAPEDWRERTGPGRARRARIEESMRPAGAAEEVEETV
jgi:SAM-dependent methyltransferase